MTPKERALHELEWAFREWFVANKMPPPDVGVIMIAVYHDGVDFQYLGRDPEFEIEWPRFFRQIVAEFDAGKYHEVPGTEVRFPSQW